MTCTPPRLDIEYILTSNVSPIEIERICDSKDSFRELGYDSIFADSNPYDVLNITDKQEPIVETSYDVLNITDKQEPIIETSFTSFIVNDCRLKSNESIRSRNF